jgi:hypothetical protein
MEIRKNKSNAGDVTFVQAGCLFIYWQPVLMNLQTLEIEKRSIQFEIKRTGNQKPEIRDQRSVKKPSTRDQVLDKT